MLFVAIPAHLVFNFKLGNKVTYYGPKMRVLSLERFVLARTHTQRLIHTIMSCISKPGVNSHSITVIQSIVIFEIVS